MGAGHSHGRHRTYLLLLGGALVAGFALHSVGLRAWGFAVSLAATAVVLADRFLRSGRDLRPAQTWARAWAKSWRRWHLVMIVLSVALGLSGGLVPNAEESGWVLLPVLLACIPLAFTPLGHLNGRGSAGDR